MYSNSTGSKSTKLLFWYTVYICHSSNIIWAWKQILCLDPCLQTQVANVKHTVTYSLPYLFFFLMNFVILDEILAKISLTWPLEDMKQRICDIAALIAYEKSTQWKWTACQRQRKARPHFSLFYNIFCNQTSGCTFKL